MKGRLWLILVPIAITVIAIRLLPHNPNMAALAGFSLVAGRYAPRPYSYILPLLTVFVTDFFIGFYQLPIMISVYLSYLIISLIGAKTGTTVKVVIGSLTGSTVFYLITNAAVWWFSPFYPATLAGLGQSYINALPFFRNSLVSDFATVIILICLIETGRVLAPKMKLLLLKTNRVIR